MKMKEKCERSRNVVGFIGNSCLFRSKVHRNGESIDHSVLNRENSVSNETEVLRVC